MPITPSGWAEIIRIAVDQKAQSLHVAFPVRVLRFHPDRESVDVQPQFLRTIEDEDGNLVNEELPTIPDVPVAWPSGGQGQHFITWPIVGDSHGNEGDTGLVVICDLDPSVWRETGRPGPTGDLRAHHLTGAVFYPGLRPQKGVLGANKRNPTKLVIGSEVFLGTAQASEPIVLGNKHKTWADAHTHATPFGPSGPPIQPYPPDALSSKHRVDE